MKSFSILAVLLLAGSAAASLTDGSVLGRSLLQNNCGRNNRRCCDTAIERRKCRNPGRSCYNDRCVRCGREGDRPCKNGARPPCQDGLARINNRCQACGSDGNTCCPRRSGQPACEDGFDCRNNRCRACGGEGQRTCSSGQPCNDGLERQNGFCEASSPPAEECGRRNGDCCVSNDRRDRCRNSDTTCINGTCENCGELGEPACNGRIQGCLSPSFLVDNNGQCLRSDRPDDCGDTGEQCCSGDNVPCRNRNESCIQNTCTVCGIEGAQPCPDENQDNDGCILGLILVGELCIISNEGAIAGNPTDNLPV